MQIKHDDMVRQLAKPGADIISQMTPLKAHLWHMASCQLGEIAELVEAMINNDRVNIVEEFGDIEFYLEGIRGALDIPRRVRKIVNGDRPSLIVESGNLFDVIKKNVIYNKELNLDSVNDALARLEAALSEHREERGITREETIDGNIAKLGKRYEGMVYSDQSAQQRADKVLGGVDASGKGIDLDRSYPQGHPAHIPSADN